MSNPISVIMLFKAIKMTNIIRQVNLVKSHVSLSQHSTVQFQADSHLQRVAHPVTPTMCQHPANRENALHERL